MRRRVLNKHKARSWIHIKWSHEDNPMIPSSSSPQWLSGDMPAMILTLPSNVFKISRKKWKIFQIYKCPPIPHIWIGGISGKLEMFLTISRVLVYYFPDVKLMSQKIHLLCLKRNATRIIQCLSIIVSRDARLLCFK